MIFGKNNLDALGSGLCKKVFSGLKVIFFEERLPDTVSLGKKKCICHTAADYKGVGTFKKRFKHAYFRRNLGASDDGYKRFLGIFENTVEKSAFLLYQKPGCRRQIV